MAKCKCGCGLDEVTSEIPYEYKRPEVGTLKDVKPEYGDTVAAQWKGNGVWEEYTYVKQHPRYGFECFLCNKDGISFIMPEDEHLWSWRIISRAQPGPVRTVTTTRYEIVPGVYGRVDVAKAPDGMVAIMIAQVWARLDGGSDRSHAILTTDELTDTIATLTAIRDAMQVDTIEK